MFKLPTGTSQATFWFYCNAAAGGKAQDLFDSNQASGAKDYVVSVQGGDRFLFVSKVAGAFGNPVSVYSRSSEIPNGSEFTKKVEFKVVYRDMHDFFKGVSPVFGFAHPHGRHILKSGPTTAASIPNIDRFTMTGNSAHHSDVYEGTYTVELHGHFGDSQEDLDTTDLGFFNKLNRDTNLERFYATATPE